MKTRIKELRELHGIGQEALAHFINSTQQTISRIENGWSVPGSDFIVNAAKHFKVSTDYILCLTDERIHYDVQHQTDKEMDDLTDVTAIYRTLDDTNKKTAMVMLKRLSEAQMEADKTKREK